MKCAAQNLEYLCIVLLAALLSAGAQVSNRGISNSMLQDAGKAIEAGDLNRAETDLQSALRISPHDYKALDLLGILRAQQRRETEAERIFMSVIESWPQVASAHIHLGLLYVQMSQPEKAVPELQEGLRLAPDRSDASDALVIVWRGQARSAVASGDSEKALSLLLQAHKLAPENPDVQFELGMSALGMRLLPDAIAAFQQTLKLRPSDDASLYGLGRAFMEESKFEDARKSFVQYVARKPDDASGHYALGMSCAALQRSSEARNEFERSISLAPVQTESYFRIGLLDLDSKDLDSATKNFRRVLDRDAKHAGALAGLGRVEFERKNYPKSAQLLENSAASDAGLREAHYYLGLAYARMGRKQESQEQFQIASRLEHEETEKQKTVFTILNPESAGADPQQPQ
jgi:tetratricopeptide (TPR) repeat protein